VQLHPALQALTPVDVQPHLCGAAANPLKHEEQDLPHAALAEFRLHQHLIPFCAGPIRQEDGNLYYEEAFGGPDGLTVKFFESWSSIRSLYKHIYMSPTVKRVFFSEAFKDLVANQVLEGPFQVIPFRVLLYPQQPSAMLWPTRSWRGHSRSAAANFPSFPSLSLPCSGSAARHASAYQ